MDLQDYKSGKVWLHVVVGPDDNDPKIRAMPPEYRPQPFVAWVAYRPGAIGDQDLAWLAAIENVRLADFQARREPTPEQANRSQRRARDRDQRRNGPNKSEEDSQPTLVDFMVRLLVDWDLTDGRDENGRPKKAELSREVFSQLEVAVRVEIVGQIVRDYLNRPNLASLSKLFSGATTESGPTGPISASELRNGAEEASLHGNGQESREVLSGTTG